MCVKASASLFIWSPVALLAWPAALLLWESGDRHGDYTYFPFVCEALCIHYRPAGVPPKWEESLPFGREAPRRHPGRAPEQH